MKPTTTSDKLNDLLGRARAGIEAAPWVIDELIMITDKSEKESEFLLNALDNLNDLPINPEWANKWCNGVTALVCQDFADEDIRAELREATKEMVIDMLPGDLYNE